MMIKRILEITLTMAHQQQHRHRQRLQNYRHINGHRFFNLIQAVQFSQVAAHLFSG